MARNKKNKPQSKLRKQMKVVAITFVIIFALILSYVLFKKYDLKYNGVKSIAFIYDTKLVSYHPGPRFPPDATNKYSIIYYKYFAKGKTYKGRYEAGASMHIKDKRFIEPKILIKYSRKHPWNHIVTKLEVE